MGRYVLNPSTPVLLRPDGYVQVGWDPRRAVLVRPPSGLSATALADLLRRLQSGATLPEIQEHADGMTADAVADLLASLAGAGVVTDHAPSHPRSVAIRIHGRGPLADLLAGALRCSGARITHSSRTNAGAPSEPTDLAVLTKQYDD